jgi:hypothetical protein
MVSIPFIGVLLLAVDYSKIRGGGNGCPSGNAAPLTKSQEHLMTDDHTTQILSARDIALLEKYKIERAERIRADRFAQFRKADGELARFLKDPYVGPPLNRAPMEEEADVVAVGGGNLDELPKQAFSTAYGGGHFEYINLLKDRRERGLLDDPHLTRG